jgi:hypothetical protein
VNISNIYKSLLLILFLIYNQLSAYSFNITQNNVIQTSYIFTFQFKDLYPQTGKMLKTRVVEKSALIVVNRIKLDAIPYFVYKITLPGIKIFYNYFIDFYAGHNSNGRYDSLSIGYAWRFELNNVAGIYKVGFVHNSVASKINLPNNTTDVKTENITQFRSFKPNQNYPNPFNPSTRFNFRIKDEGIVSISGFGVKDREIATLLNGNLPVGNFHVEWNATNEESGM